MFASESTFSRLISRRLIRSFLPILLLISTVGTFTLSAQNPELGPTPNTAGEPFKVLSWNIYMLPLFAKITGKRQRSHAIAHQLKDSECQMLVLQEAFLGDSRRIIEMELSEGYPYRFGPANKKFSIKTNSGIWILSRIPMRYLGEIDFSECAGFDDCMARKGALLVETEWNGVTVQVLGTHLQAGGPHSIRHSQYDEIRALLDLHRKDGVPQLICGDMNTSHLDSTNYARMMTTMDAEDGPLIHERDRTERGYPCDMHKGGFRSERIIDYIFYRANGRSARSLRRTMPAIRERWNKRHEDLSDHFPVEIEVVW